MRFPFPQPLGGEVIRGGEGHFIRGVYVYVRVHVCMYPVCMCSSVAHMPLAPSPYMSCCAERNGRYGGHARRGACAPGC